MMVKPWHTVPHSVKLLSSLCCYKCLKDSFDQTTKYGYNFGLHLLVLKFCFGLSFFLPTLLLLLILWWSNSFLYLLISFEECIYYYAAKFTTELTTAGGTGERERERGEGGRERERERERTKSQKQNLTTDSSASKLIWYLSWHQLNAMTFF